MEAWGSVAAMIWLQKKNSDNSFFFQCKKAEFGHVSHLLLLLSLSC